MNEHVCACEKRKIPYFSRPQAADALRNMKHISTGTYGVNRLNIYKCGNYWHIGHRPNKQYQRIMRKKGMR